MTDFDRFLIYVTNRMAKFGFKLKKKDFLFFQHSDNYEFKIILIHHKKEYIGFRYFIYNDKFIDIYEKITEIKKSYGLIDFIASMAFLDWPNSEYVNMIYFKDKTPWNIHAMTLEQAEYEFKRLMTGHMLPWFDKYKNPVNIRNIFRDTPEKYDTKRNINFSPTFSSDIGGYFEIFYEDVILSRLIGDDLRPAQVIYDEYYREAYYKYWSKNDDSGVSLMEQERVKNHFEILPSIIEKIEAITNAQWAEYRILTGIGVEHDG